MTSLSQQFTCNDAYDPNALPVAVGRQLILDAVAPIEGVEHLPLREALGRVLAEAVISPIDVPAHDNSAMDGYGLRGADLHSDGPTTLQVIGSAYAGRPFPRAIGPGEAVRIMTGAPLPDGVDTVVMQEVVTSLDDQVTIPPGQRMGQNVRKAGEDLRAGSPALPAGKLLRPAELGLIASLGISEISVRRRLRVAIFSTGDEVVPLGTIAREGEIFDSNRYTLFGMLTRLGVEVIDLGVVRDDPLALEGSFREAASIADVVITSGGVSVGEADFTRSMMNKLGEVLFWKIAMKPGRPMAFGHIGADGDGAWLFGLPGNPVAVMVTFYQFARPALLRLAGVEAPGEPPELRAMCTVSIRKGRGRTEFLRGQLYAEDGEWKVRTTGAQGSGILRSMTEANCFIVLGPGQGDVAAGDDVTVQILDGLV
ncbi:MAG: molybdopterin molybdotransferase MoeA [Proteobacteria bacterium]|nr:molybdopterin molybdotransferase MoeA [Pseudomonadota bacterium]